MTPSKLFLALMGLLLLGYAFLDRGFAALPFAPLFVGEIALLAGLLAVLAGAVSANVVRSRVSWMLLAFVVWGLFVALPDISTYGLLVYRDSVVWIYAFFALFVGGSLIKSGEQPRVLDWYGRWFPWFLFWAPAAFLFSSFYSDSLPRLFGSDVPILAMKPGDIAVHVAGAGAFMLLGLHKVYPNSRTRSQYRDLLLWSVWAIIFVVLASRNRGGMLAVIGATLLVLAVRRTKQSPRLLLGIGLSAAAFTVFFVVVGEVQLQGRTISLSQVVQNAISIVDAPSNSGLAGTIDWRLNWWDRVIHYTILGDNFWTGKGFGINLADSDGFQTNGDLRSPHNGTMTILARSGVPGLTLWLMILATFYGSMVRTYRSARRLGQWHFANVSLWVLAYTTAFLVNMSFDVYLEGPQGGIWFWSVIGFGIALSEAQQRGVKPATGAVAASIRTTPTTRRNPSYLR